VKRVLALALAAGLLFSTAAPTSAHYAPYRHWHYVNSYIQAKSSPDWYYQVVGYYHIRMNGSSPGYVPSIQATSAMSCRVPYANFFSITITYCGMDRQSWYAPDRWMITVHYRTCFLWSGWPSCAEHGIYLQLRATGQVMARGTW
jgi:hypothetical protein